MFLIQNYSIVNNYQYSTNQSNQYLNYNARHNLHFYNQYQTSFNYHIRDLNYSFSLIKNVRVAQQFNSICIRFLQFSDRILKINNKSLRIQLLKKFLLKKINNNDLVLTIHPRTGQIYLSRFKMNYSNHQCLYNFIQQYVNHHSHLIFDNAFREYNYLLNLIKEIKSQDQQYNQKSNLFQQFSSSNLELKKMVMLSSYYSWSILSSITKETIFCADAYAESKSLVVHLIKKIVQTNPFCQKLKQLYNTSIESLTSIRQNTMQQDNIIKNRYLNSISRTNQIFIKNININQQFFQAIQHKSQIKINSLEGPIPIKIHKFTQNKINQLKFEKQLLLKMPNEQFPGLPKYYFIKNYEAQTQLYRFTNLYSTTTLQTFFESNSETVSLQSKIHIFLQIILSLRYLRNNKIVYFNLIPQNIFIKKSQLIKLFDFTNSSSDLCTENKYHQSKLPYVLFLKLIDININKQEKSDVFSFGCLLYKCIFQKFPLNIKDSTLFDMDPIVYTNKLTKKIVSTQITNSYKMDLFKVLMYFCLISFEWNTKFKKNQFQDRPFMDWAVIFIKHIQTSLLQYQSL